MNNYSKLFTLLISLCISSTTFCEKYSGGNGTIKSPFEINSLNDLRTLSQTPKDWNNKHFVITADIDASATKKWNIGNHDNDCETPVVAMGFSPIGNQEQQRFTGSLNGNGHTIKNLYINRPKETLTGLFGYLGSPKQKHSEVKNLKLENCNITGIVTGSVAGFAILATIENCSVTGKVYGNIEAGGLIGFCENAKLKNSTANMIVKCLEGDAAGCVAFALSTELKNCKATGFTSTQTRFYKNYSAAKLVACKDKNTTTEKCDSKVRIIHYNPEALLSTTE